MVSLVLQIVAKFSLHYFQVFCYVRWSTSIFVAFLVFHSISKTNVNTAKILDCLSVKKVLEQVVLREFFFVSRSLWTQINICYAERISIQCSEEQESSLSLFIFLLSFSAFALKYSFLTLLGKAVRYRKESNKSYLGTCQFLSINIKTKMRNAYFDRIRNVEKMSLSIKKKDENTVFLPLVLNVNFWLPLYWGLLKAEFWLFFNLWCCIMLYLF